MDVEVCPSDHGQIIRIRGMEERVEVGKACPARGQVGEILILARNLVVNIFENNDQHAIEMPSPSPHGSPRSLFLFS